MKVGRFVLLAMLFVFLNANLGCIYTACDMYIPGGGGKGKGQS